MNAPSVVTGVQGAEQVNVGKGEHASGVINEEAKVVGKVYTTQIPTPKPTVSIAKPVS